MLLRGAPNTFRTFESPQEEIDYWKQMYHDKNEELDEFVSSSRELEEELEAELSRKDATLKDMQDTIDRLTNDLKEQKVLVARVLLELTVHRRLHDRHLQIQASNWCSFRYEHCCGIFHKRLGTISKASSIRGKGTGREEKVGTDKR